MRNFTREGAAVSSGHTQRLEYPYPPAHPRREARRHSWRGGLCYGGVYPAAGAGYGARGYLRRGGAGAGEYRGGGLPGQTGRFPGQTRRISGRLPGAGYYRRRGRLPVPERGVYRGRGYPGGRRGGTAYPRRGGYPAAAPPAKITVFRRLVTGSRRTRSLCAFPGGYPRRGGAKNIFSGARVFVPEYGLAHIVRLYRSGASGRGYGDTH